MEIKEIRDKILETEDVTSCAVMMINKEGEIIEYVITDPTKTIIDLSDLIYAAKLFSLRYGIVGFDKILGGLKMTVDTFSDLFTVSTAIEEDLLVAIIPHTPNMNTIKFIQDMKDILSLELKNKIN